MASCGDYLVIMAFFEMDADLSHDPKDLIEMCKCLENSECEVVIGSRYINGINVVNWPLNRIILSYCASIYARIVTGIPVKDSTSGFVGFKSEVLKSIDLKSILFNGYAFQIELKFKAFKNNYKIKEIPIILKDRIYGDSKMSGSIIFEAIFGLIKLKFLSFLRNSLMNTTLIRGALIINEGRQFKSDILIKNDLIYKISKNIIPKKNYVLIDASDKILIPGIIDDQVHFREPGLTHKATIETESKAAVAGITSYIEMPNTKPQTTTISELERKFELAKSKSYANYSFMFGGTNNNLDEIKKLDKK